MKQIKLYIRVEDVLFDNHPRMQHLPIINIFSGPKKRILVAESFYFAL